MIEVEFSITSPLNSPDGTLMDHVTARVAEPYSLVGELLTAELDRTYAHLYEDVLGIRKRYLSGEPTQYDGGGEGYYLNISDGIVAIETIFDEPPRTCNVPEEQFWPVIDQWMEFVESHNNENHGTSK